MDILFFVAVDGVVVKPKTSVKTDPKLTALLKDGTGAMAGRARDLFLALATCNAMTRLRSWSSIRANRRTSGRRRSGEAGSGSGAEKRGEASGRKVGIGEKVLRRGRGWSPAARAARLRWRRRRREEP